MIKLIELTKNQKQEYMKIDYVMKTSKNIVATVKDKYRCEIINTSNGAWGAETPVKVYCSCHDFQFRWAYVLHQHKALLYTENFVLEPPKHRNPGMVVGACKHLAAVANDLLSDKKQKE